MIRYYWGRFWPFLLFAFGIEAVENLFTVFFEYRNMVFGLLPLLKTAYVFVTEFAVTMCYWLIPYAVYLWILPRGKAGGKADRWLTSAWFFLFVLANLWQKMWRKPFSGTSLRQALNFICGRLPVLPRRSSGIFTSPIPSFLFWAAFWRRPFWPSGE